jgi:MYXO-CTERM domain-containing protein
MSRRLQQRQVSQRRRDRRQRGKAFFRKEHQRLLAMGVGLSLQGMAASQAVGQISIGDGYGSATVANESGWTFGAEFGSIGPNLWANGVSPLFEQGFFFSEAGSDQGEQRLWFQNQVIEDVSDDTITLGWLANTSNGGEVQFTETYTLVDTGSATSSIVNTTLTIENISEAAAIDLNVFWYADFDLDEVQEANDFGRVNGTNTVQSGGSVGTQLAISGAGTTLSGNATLDRVAFDQPGTLQGEMEDGTPTDGGFGSALAGPGDVAQLFQWSVGLGNAGDVQMATIEFEQLLTPEVIVLPGSIDDPEPDDGEGDGYGSTFNFEDDTPPKRGFDPPTFYDPDFAIGYDFAIDGDDNGFGEIFLPVGIGDDVFSIEVTDPGSSLFGNVYDLTATLDAGGDPAEVLDFLDLDPAGLVASFRLLGIELDEQIDPANPLGFPIGLTFAEDTPVAFSQTAIVRLGPDDPTAVVPQPAAAAMGLAALIGLAGRRRRGR